MVEIMENIDKQSTEQQILAAAEREFLTKGYDGARTTSIAQAAGVTHAMLHYYFRTKEQLFERIVNEKFDVALRSMLSVLGDSELPIVSRICSGIASHFDFFVENPELPRFVINEIVSRQERYGVLTSRLNLVASPLFEKLQQDINQAALRGEIERVDAKMLLISIISLNVFTFISYPIMEAVMSDLMEDRDAFLAARKAENIEIIMRRIKLHELL